MKENNTTNSKSYSLRITILGGFNARVAEKSILDAGYAKLRGLLAFLAMQAGAPAQREYLADLFWPEMPVASARQNLRRAIFNLKSALHPSGDVLIASRDEVALAPADWLDVTEFTAAFAAPCRDNPPSLRLCAPCFAQREYQAMLYRGEFMAGFSLPDCPEFEEWLQIRRESLHRHALALLEKLSDCYEGASDYAKALQFALRHSELEPWSESGHRRVMRLYALNGQSRAAIAQYEACCRLLKNELNALPSAETRQLAERIHNGELLGAPFDRLRANGIHEAIPQIQAERRQVTVLYCELIAIPEDPDEAIELLEAPQALCTEIIQRFSGHIVEAHGGGLLAYFGYPHADEFAARNAVRAALEITRLAMTPSDTRAVEIRAGVHTGLVITGSDPFTPDMTGRTSRLAIQLRLGTAPNEAVISWETRRIVAGYFDIVELNSLTLPGMAQPLEIFRVLNETGACTRLHAAKRLTPLVGRNAEISRLLGLWNSSARGSQYVVLLRGEAGIGKSRLVHALKERLAAYPHAIRELRCFPEFRQSPFHPLIAMLETIFGFAHEDAPEQKSGKLAQHLEANFPALAQDAVPLLAHLLALPVPGNYAELALSPQKRKDRTIAALFELLQSQAWQQPVLLILEDLHWVDPSTLELLTRFVKHNRNAPILALLTARPEFDPPWDESFDITWTLDPLRKENVMEMIASISDALPDTIASRIVERADGVPLFVEEMVQFAANSSEAAIPASLHDLLAARVDSMGDAKSLAQIAAAIGREFDEKLLRKASACDSRVLSQGLLALHDAGLIFKVSETGRQFRHALIQEAAYQSMTKSVRRTVHGQIAHALLDDFPEAVASQPELLAQHLAAAGETLLAAGYWLKAGQQAFMNSALTEAIGHFNSGQQLLASLLTGEERDSLEYELRVGLGTALVAARGYGSAEAGEAYARALELSESASDNSGLFKALLGMWFTSSSRISHAHSLELAGNLLYLAEQSGNQFHLQIAHHAMGNSSFMTGNLAAAHRHLERVISIYQPIHHEAVTSQYGENICVSSEALMALVLWLRGFPDQADAASTRAIALARQVRHANSLGYALCTAAILNRWANRPEVTELLAREAMALSHEHGLPLWMGMGASSRGWVQAMQGDVAGAAQIQKCLDAVDAVMSGARLFFLAPLCDALVHLKRYEDALLKIDEALVALDERESRFFESEFHRLKGVCLLKMAGTASREVEACFRQALEISQRQGAKALELRAATSLARLRQQQGEPNHAWPLLEEIYRGFTEGFDTQDLLSAKVLLQQRG